MAKRKRKLYATSGTGYGSVPSESHPIWGGLGSMDITPAPTFGTSVASTSVAAPNPAAPPASYGPPVMPDPFGIISGATNSANTTYGNTVGQINTGENSLASDYGFNLTRDPTSGAVTGYAIDPNVDANNPFSRAALLNKSYRQEQARTTNGAAGAFGSLFNGAARNARNADTSNYNQGVDALIKGFGQGITGYENARTTAGTTRDTTIGNAGQDNLNQILNSDPGTMAALIAATAPAVDPATAGLKFNLAPGYELYRDPFTGELKARKKVGG